MKKTLEAWKPFRNVLPEIGENCVENKFHLFFKGLFYPVWSVDMHTEMSEDLPEIYG
jgi:hypothetical protein